MMSGSKAVLDANVLYSAPVRDLMLSLAMEKLFEPLWSTEIQNEWIENLLNKRKDLTRNQLIKAHKAMNTAFPNAEHDDYQEYLEQCKLPDKKDHHVLALALSQKAPLIVSFNQKDFPMNSLKQHLISCLDPDSFACKLFEEDKKLVLLAFTNMQKRLKSPPITEERLLEIYTHVGLKNFAFQLISHVNH